MLTDLLHPLLGLHGWPVYAVTGALVFAETGLLIGFFFPGESAIIVGGVICSRHHDSLWVLMAVAVAAAVVGGMIGYLVGRQFGPRLVESRPLRSRRRAIDGTNRFLARRGAWAVFACRFTPFLRAVIPGLAGMSDMRWRPFALANAGGGVVWAIGYATLGFVVGDAYLRLEHYSDVASYALLAVVVAVVAVAVLRARRREHNVG